MNFVEALHGKYVAQEEFGDCQVLPKDEIISTQITLVGFARVSEVQKQLKRLVSIDLSRLGVQYAGPIHELQGILDKVQILNLAENKLNWFEVTVILSCLPNLKELILTGNDLNSDSVPMCHLGKKRLKSLVLGKHHMNFAQTIDILRNIWIEVEQLDLWHCYLDAEKMKLKDTSEVNSFTRSILSLKLSHNQIQDMSWIHDVPDISNLIDLDLSNCGMTALNLDEQDAKRLRGLKFLNISHNDIGCWADICQLNYLNLESLICHENPFFICEKQAKMLTIARLATIKILNREEIPDAVRRDCEIFFVTKYYQDYLRKGVDFRRNFGRYEHLLIKYELADRLSANHVKEQYVTVKLCHCDKQVDRKLPLDMRISNLKVLCKRLFKLRASSNVEIHSKSADLNDTQIEYPLDKDGQTLHFFSIKDGQNLQVILNK